MPFDQAKLNDRVVEACRFLAAAMPRHFAGMHVADRDGFVEIELLNPYRSDRPLQVSTDRGELTVAFAGCHSHYDDGQGTSDEAGAVGEMIARAVLVATGAEVVHAVWSGGRGLAGGWLAAAADPAKRFDAFPAADRVQIIAWEPWADAEVRRERGGA